MIYIQRNSDGHYFAGDDHWTENRASALTYLSSVAALSEKITTDAEIVMTFEGCRASYDVHLKHPKTYWNPQQGSSQAP